jgi:hypothetical protein
VSGDAEAFDAVMASFGGGKGGGGEGGDGGGEGGGGGRFDQSATLLASN